MPNFPALLLLTSQHDATWYKIDEEIHPEKLAEFSQEKTTFSDKEGAFPTSGVGAYAGPVQGDNMNSERSEDTRKFLQTIEEKTKEILEKEDYKHIVYCSPERLKNDITELMKKVANKIEMKYMIGNFMRENYEGVQELFKKSLKAF